MTIFDEIQWQFAWYKESLKRWFKKRDKEIPVTELKLYSVALRAWNRDNFNSLAADYVTALNQEGAELQAKQVLDELYPENGWWHDQDFSVTEVPQDVLEYVLGTLDKN